MKAINKIIILGMVTALFSSCDLTLLPENAVTPENYFKNKSDLELWTNSLYITGRTGCRSRNECR